VSETFVWGAPGTTDANDGGQLYVMAVRWSATADGSWTGVQWRVPDSLSGDDHFVLAYQDGDSDTPRRSQAISPTPGGYQNFPFASPLAVTAGTKYLACVLTNHYVFTSAYPLPQTNGQLTADGFFLKTTTADDAKFPDVPTTLNFHVSPIVDFAAVHGTAAVPLGGLSIAAAGHVTRHGTAAASPGGLAVSAAGHRTVHGAEAAGLGGLALAAAGHVTVHGAAALLLGGIVVAASSGSTVVRRPDTGTITRPNDGLIHVPHRTYP
jgi:hypothetical protein